MLKLFCFAFKKCGIVRVIECKPSFNYFIYAMTKYEFSEDKVWYVSWQPSTRETKCSCCKMELIGLVGSSGLGIIKKGEG